MIKPLVFTVCLFSFSTYSFAELSEAKQLLSDTALSSSEPQEIARQGDGFTTCLLTPSIDIQVASPVIGVIKKVLVKRGDRVKKNQILVELHAEVEKATLNLNRAQAAYGQRTIKRNEDLYKRRLISEQEKDEIVINNRIYSFEAAQTRALLKQKTIRSPVTGIVVDTFLDQGEYVGEDPIMQVVGLDPLYVEVVLPSSKFDTIKTGDVAEVTLASPLNSSHKASVVIVDSILDAASGTFGVRLELSNPDYKLPAGLKCDIRFKNE